MIAATRTSGWQQWAVVGAVTATIGINYLANALPLAGNTTGALSEQYPVLITPAGYAFAIWGLIYTGLIAFTLYQARPALRTQPVLETIRWPFILSCVANVTWLFLWHYEQVTLSLAAMLGLLGLLLTIYRRIAQHASTLSRLERWVVQRPFSLYLGWITVATVVNTAVVLYVAGWRGAPLTPTGWVVLLLGIVTLIATWVTTRRRDAVYGAVIVWAALAIAVKQPANIPILSAALLTALIVGLAALRYARPAHLA